MISARHCAASSIVYRTRDRDEMSVSSTHVRCYRDMFFKNPIRSSTLYLNTFKENFSCPCFLDRNGNTRTVFQNTNTCFFIAAQKVIEDRRFKLAAGSVDFCFFQLAVSRQRSCGPG